jgi:hypothetical protein
LIDAVSGRARIAWRLVTARPETLPCVSTPLERPRNTGHDPEPTAFTQT